MSVVVEFPKNKMQIEIRLGVIMNDGTWMNINERQKRQRMRKVQEEGGGETEKIAQTRTYDSYTEDI